MSIFRTFTLRRIFPLLVEEDLQLLQHNSLVIKLKKGQNLFLSGDYPRSIYCVASGCLKIVREGHDGDSVLIRVVKAGEFVGMREVFGEFKYSRTCIALKETEVFSIDKEFSVSLLEKNPKVSLQFMRIFSNELARIESRIETRLHKAAKNRVAATILDLYHLFSEDDSLTFDVPLNRRDIAELSDVTPETVSRCLAELKKLGLIEVRGSTFVIRDLYTLEMEAEDW